MKVPILNFEMQKTKEIELPSCFTSRVRADIIHKIFEASKKQQPYSSYILAGKEASASGKQRHRRHKYKTLYGLGVSRVPRKVLTRRGERFYWRGAFIPGTVGGRAAHPPKTAKRELKVNKKEKKLALNSAIAATASPDVLEKKYKLKLKQIKLPIIIESSIIEKKAKEIVAFISKLLGIKVKEEKKVRAGKGKRRGRKYKKSVKVLVVTAPREKLKVKSFGLDMVNVKQLSISLLAPGGTPGRIVIWTENAINEMKK